MHKSSLRQEEKKASLIKVTKQAALFILIFRSMAFACLSLSLHCLLVISFPCMLNGVLCFLNMLSVQNSLKFRKRNQIHFVL